MFGVEIKRSPCSGSTDNRKGENMPTVPKKVYERLVSGIKQFQPILSSAKSRDVNEADTVTIVKDMLADVFGYEKYSEVTSEFSIRGNYCDLATKLNGTIATLIEVKAIGLDLKDQHVKQAVDYAANQGVDWVLLTNGIIWRVYRIQFTKPIEQELVIDVDFSNLNHKLERDIELLYLWCKEGWVRSVLGDYHSHKQALSRYLLGAVILTEPVLEVIRRELRRLSPGARIDTEEIKSALVGDVLKREILEGEKADEAKKKISRAANNALRAKAVKDEPQSTPVVASPGPETP
jgi:predicted type IV restriction endonuclease